jgi:hypothetical protein
VEPLGAPAEVLAGAQDHARPETEMLRDLAGARDHARPVQHAVEEGAAAQRPLGTERPLEPPEKAQSVARKLQS